MTNLTTYCLELYERERSIVNLDEFKADYHKIGFIQKILRIYKESGRLNVRLLINHFIILHNMFGIEATRILARQCAEDLLPEMKALLRFFSRLPANELIIGWDNEPVDFSNVQIDPELEKLFENAFRNYK